MIEKRHVLPVVETRPHVTDGSPCWCDPEYKITCPYCDGSGHPAWSPWTNCWMCGGASTIDVDLGHDDHSPVYVIHRRQEKPK